MAELGAREHLFVSFAAPEWALAEWLTLRLTAEGYRVWCERFHRLGGEPYPRDVAAAIRHETDRFLMLFSRAALQDPKQSRERALAFHVTEERGRDFVIPLTVDRLRPPDVWPASERTLIAFDERWATGFGGLVERLQVLGAPRPLRDGARIAADARQRLTARRSWQTVL